MLTDLLEAYSEIARPIILDYYKASSCIGSTEITIRVLSQYGYRAKRYPCNVQVYNAQFGRFTRRLGRMPTLAEAQPWFSLGAHSVGIGYPDTDISAHVVALVEHTYLVDAALDQCDRPHKKITLPGVFVAKLPAPVVHLPDPTQVYAYQLLPGGITVAYLPAPTNPFFLTSPDYLFPERQSEAVSRIITTLKEKGHHILTGKGNAV